MFLLKQDFSGYRDELVISTKAGWNMWPGPYGDFGSRKYLIASLDQSLKRMGLDYVDIFYHHRPDPETPLEEQRVSGLVPYPLEQLEVLGVAGPDLEQDPRRPTKPARPARPPDPTWQ